MLWIVAVALVVAGLIGVVMPGLPGAALVWAGLAVGAWADGFSRVSVFTVFVLGALAASTYAIDFLAAAAGVKHAGASRRAMIGAALGTLLGLVFGLPGVILGPFVGAVAGELSARNDLRHASRVGLAAWIGFVVGTAVKIGVIFLMIGVFLLAFFV
jgi:uncharacterized protein YqgC (DUF456 family)